MYSLIRTENFNTYKIRHFIVDSTSDLPNIVTDYEDELHAGWTATVVADKEKIKKYALLNDKENWAETIIAPLILI